MLAAKRMLTAMNKAQIKANLDRLRTGVAPKFQEDMKAIADSLEKLLDGASKGGKARAKKLTKKRRSEIARNAANTRWGKSKPAFGSEADERDYLRRRR